MQDENIKASKKISWNREIKKRSFKDFNIDDSIDKDLIDFSEASNTEINRRKISGIFSFKSKKGILISTVIIVTKIFCF